MSGKSHEPVRMTDENFFKRDGLTVAPELVGKLIIRQHGDGIITLRITETECYLGENDTACHASKGRTPRTEMLYKSGGTIYVYLCYGIHCLMNIITGEAEQPQGVVVPQHPGRHMAQAGKFTDCQHDTLLIFVSEPVPV